MIKHSFFHQAIWRKHLQRHAQQARLALCVHHFRPYYHIQIFNCLLLRFDHQHNEDDRAGNNFLTQPKLFNRF